MTDDLNFTELPPMQPQSTLNRVQYIEDTDVSIGEWVGTMLLMCIPLVNVIMLFIWAFDSTAKLSKSNWAKATLIFGGISIFVGIFCAILFGSLFSSLLGSSGLPSSFY